MIVSWNWLKQYVALDMSVEELQRRLMMAGPATACLRLRAKALDLGLADDEMTIASTEVERRAVYCVHCRTVTSQE